MPGTENVHAVQAVFLFLMVLVALFGVVAQRVKIPYPILLVVAGLGLSFVPHVPRVRLDPDLVFLVFLPPLLYAAAWQTSWREFRANLVSILLLAVGLVGFTVWGVAEIADHFITALDWKSGFVLGAVVATTDAIAAAAIARQIGLPQRVMDILEGESLVNDATGLLALEFGLQILTRGDAPGPVEGGLRLLWLMGGGVAVGLAIGWVVAKLERAVDDGPLEMVMSLIVPYAAYLAAEEARASGVLAVVACGLYLSRKSATLFSPRVRLQVSSGWEALNFLLNGFVFALIGLQLPYVLAGIGGYSRWTLLEYGLIFSVVLIALRLVWVYPGAWLAWVVNRRMLGVAAARPAGRQVFVVGWTGMRGVIALAAAISLPETMGDGRVFAQRNLIVFLTFSVILVTLVVQGLSLPAVIRTLGLAGEGDHGADEEMEARCTVLNEALEHLQEGQAQASGKIELHAYKDLMHRYQHRLEAVRARREEARVEDDDARAEAGERVSAFKGAKEIALETVRVERRTMIRLRDEGKIGDETLRRMERELDLTEAR